MAKNREYEAGCYQCDWCEEDLPIADANRAVRLHTEATGHVATDVLEQDDCEMEMVW